jgi:hypothetical protein
MKVGLRFLSFLLRRIWPLLDNDLVNTFPRLRSQQWKDLLCWVTSRSARFVAADETDNNRRTVRGSGLRIATSYKREDIRESSFVREFNHSTFVREFHDSVVREFRSWVFRCGVLTSGERKMKKWPISKSEPSQSQWKRRRSWSGKECSES